jgi:hypothetical protein
MSVFIVKHINQDVPREVLAQIEYYASPGEDIMSYTQEEMAQKCGFNYQPNKGQVITITLRN